MMHKCKNCASEVQQNEVHQTITAHVHKFHFAAPPAALGKKCSSQFGIVAVIQRTKFTRDRNRKLIILDFTGTSKKTQPSSEFYNRYLH